MTKYTELMLQYSDNELNTEQALLFEKELSENDILKQEYALNLDIDRCMKGEAIINEISSDAELSFIETTTKHDIADFIIDESDNNHGLEFFIKGALAENEKVEKQIDEAEREMNQYGIDSETRVWVDSWYQQKEQLLGSDPVTQEILDFVKKGMQADYMPEKEIVTKKPMRKLLFRVASVAAIFILSFSLWMLFSTKPSTEELFAEYYKPYPVIDGQTRSNEENVNQAFKDAVKKYKNNDFKASALAFERLIGIDKSAKMRLLFSITQIELQNYEEAISGFNHIINTNAEFVIEAKWYLTMCYLKTDKIDKAKSLLSELSVTPGYYKSKAIELLDKL